MAPDPAWLAQVPQGGAFLASASAAAVLCALLRVLAARTGPGRAAIRGLHVLEGSVVALLLAAMLLLSFGQIMLRNIAHTGLLWVDPLLRHLLLWVGFLGAMLATRLDRHISVDAFTRLLRGQRLRVVRAATSMSAATLCVVLSSACMAALRDEAGAHTVGFLGIPVWCLQVVMPFALFVMASRFFRHALESIGGRMPPLAARSAVDPGTAP